MGATMSDWAKGAGAPRQTLEPARLALIMDHGTGHNCFMYGAASVPVPTGYSMC